MHTLDDLNAFQDRLKANKKCHHDFVSTSLIFYSIVCHICINNIFIIQMALLYYFAYSHLVLLRILPIIKKIVTRDLALICTA